MAEVDEYGNSARSAKVKCASFVNAKGSKTTEMWQTVALALSFGISHYFREAKKK